MLIKMSAMRNIMYTLIVLLAASFTGSRAKNIDSLQKQLDTASTDQRKAQLYAGIADELIQFTGQKTREITYAEAGKAVEYVLKAIHYNSKLNDTLAIRDNFNCLSAAYFIQHKFTQAKWFALQSNYISRNRKDAPAMINSLMQLASIKIAIKDYKMAEKDFNEAITLTKYVNNVQRQIAIEKCLATLYENTQRSKQALATEKHCDYLAANINKITAQQAKINAIRAAEQARSDAERAKAKAVKMAELAKIAKANEAKIALQQAKDKKVKEERYLAMLKKQYKWPYGLTLPKADPEVLKADLKQAKMQQAKQKSYLALLKKRYKWPSGLTLPRPDLEVKNNSANKAEAVLAATEPAQN